MNTGFYVVSKVGNVMHVAYFPTAAATTANAYREQTEALFGNAEMRCAQPWESRKDGARFDEQREETA